MDRVVHIEEGVVRDLPDVAPLCDAMEIEKGKIDIGDCNLYCEQEGKGMPLVVLHGGPGATHHYFHPHFARAGKFAKVIYYDQRGCGLSDYAHGAGYTVDQAADDLEKLRKALAIDRWVVLGSSYGGLLAQHYATRYPDKLAGLVLTGAATGLPGGVGRSRQHDFLSPEELEKIGQIRREGSLSTAQRIYNAFLNGDWKRQNFYRPSKERIAQIALYEWVHDKDFNAIMSGSMSGVDLEGAFERCPIPTLIMEGRWDMTWNEHKAKILKDNHSGARLVMFEKSAHNPFSDEPEKFFRELKKFMKSLRPMSTKKLARWKEHLAERQAERERDPAHWLDGLGWGRKSNQQIAERYSPDWLDQLNNPSALLKTGFALYDVKRYAEALAVFEKMEQRASGHRLYEAVGLIWQGHMLDLLHKRKQAISIYKKVTEMGVTSQMQHDQFGISYSPSRYAQKRTKKAFKRIENRDDG